MGILRSDRVSGLGGANAINGSVFFGRNGTTAVASGNWLTAYSESDFNFGLGDFTIEYWFYFNGVTGSNSGSFQISNTPGGINNANGASTGGLALDYENNCVKGIGNNGWFNGTNSVSVETWNHVALVRYSGTLQIFTNGVADTSASDSQNYSLTHLAIGGYYTTSHLFQGYISNFRIQKGKAEYSSAFTPPAQRLEKTPETVILCCQSPGNIFQEATGKTLEAKKVFTTADSLPLASHFAPDKGEDHGTTFADNTKFDTFSYMVPPGGTTEQRGRDRGVMMGGAEYPTAESNIIEYIRISSGGITKDFGDLVLARGTAGSASSSTRGVMVAGMSGATRKNEMDYITIATTGNALDFGNYIEDLGYLSGVSNQTRGVAAGGNGPSSPSNTNQIGYITIATTGNASDFGDLTAVAGAPASSASPTRGLFALGYSPSFTNTIDYITIATTGNAADYGDMARTNIASGTSCASATRALFAGGYNNTPASGTEVNNIDYVTIASTGNSTDFGDLTIASWYLHGTSNGTRGVFAGRMTTAPTTSDPRIDSVVIATLGNAVDWGYQNRMECGPDEGQPIRRRAGAFVSDSHGGIS